MTFHLDLSNTMTSDIDREADLYHHIAQKQKFFTSISYLLNAIFKGNHFIFFILLQVAGVFWFLTFSRCSRYFFWKLLLRVQGCTPRAGLQRYNVQASHHRTVKLIVETAWWRALIREFLFSFSCQRHKSGKFKHDKFRVVIVNST